MASNRRKIPLVIIGLLIGAFLTFSLIIKSPLTEVMQKSGFLLTSDKVTKNHYQKQITLTAKTLPVPQLPAHPVSKSINQLEETIHTILDDPRLAGAIAGISVRQVEDESLLFTHNANIRLRPASNMKIITSIAALETLGPDYQFTTEVSTDGTVKKGVIDGNLYIVGKGDPTLQKKDFDDLAKQLSEKGIKKVKGAIIADDSWYDDVRYSQDLDWSDETNYTGSAVSALTASPNDDHLTGSIIVDVFPANEVGEKPKVVITPETSYIKIVNHAKTVASNEVNNLTTEREHGSNNLIVEGEIPVNSRQYHRWRSVWEPTGYALDLFVNSLKEHGIKYDQANTKIGVAPESRESLVIKKSPPLKELIIHFMKLSNNAMGEVFTKEMGKVIYNEGSWDKGLEVMEEAMQKLGINRNDFVFRDGSGMSHKNLISPNHFTSMLVNIRDKNWFSHFESSFPIAGEPNRLVGGTLSHRMVGDSTKGNVKAKTGTIKGVSTLSGYVTTKDGVKLAFSIMLNNYIKDSVIDIQDQIVTVLAESKLN